MGKRSLDVHAVLISEGRLEVEYVMKNMKEEKDRKQVGKCMGGNPVR